MQDEGEIAVTGDYLDLVANRERITRVKFDGSMFCRESTNVRIRVPDNDRRRPVGTDVRLRATAGWDILPAIRCWTRLQSFALLMKNAWHIKILFRPLILMAS